MAAVEPTLPVLEKDNPIQYNLISAQLRILDRNSALTIIDAGAHHGHTTEQYLENFIQARVIGVEPDRENFAKAAARVADLAAVWNSSVPVFPIPSARRTCIGTLTI